MKRAHSTVAELSDLEDHDYDEPDSSEDSSTRVDIQPLPKRKAAKRESTCIEHVSSDVIVAAGHVIELLNSPADAATGFHMLAAWAEDATAAAILCRLPVLGQLHMLSQHDDDRGEKACQVLACIASRHSSLAATLLQTLGPADFFGALRGLPTSDKVRILAEHLPTDLLVSTLVAPSPSEAMLTMVNSMLIGMIEQTETAQSLATEVFTNIHRYLTVHNYSLLAVQSHLDSRQPSSARAVIALLSGLLALNQPALPGLADLIHPVSQLLFYPPDRQLYLRILLAAQAQVAAHHYTRAVMQQVVAVIESEAQGLDQDGCRTLAAQLLLRVLQSPHAVRFAVLELVNPPVLMLTMDQCLRCYCIARRNSSLIVSMLRITTVLLRSSSSLKFSLLPLVPVEELMGALHLPELVVDLSDCIQEYIKHAEDVAQRLCQQDQVRDWYHLFITNTVNSRLKDLAANVLRAGSETGREFKTFLAEPSTLQQLGVLLESPLQSWHSHVIWMLRFASSGSERRKAAVFEHACRSNLGWLTHHLQPESFPAMQHELSAFFKSLTSLAGPRKTAIFHHLNLTNVSRLLRSPDEAIQEHVAGLLRNLTHGDNIRKQATYQAMDLRDVLQLLTSPSVRVLQSVTGLLQNLCTRDEGRRDAIFGQLPLATVIDLLRNPDIRVHAPTAGLLMNLCRSSRQRKRSVLEALPLSLVTNFYENGPPPPALADQAAGLTQHMRMAFLSVSREQLHQLVRDT